LSSNCAFTTLPNNLSIAVLFSKSIRARIGHPVRLVLVSITVRKIIAKIALIHETIGAFIPTFTMELILSEAASVNCKFCTDHTSLTMRQAISNLAFVDACNLNITVVKASVKVVIFRLLNHLLLKILKVLQTPYFFLHLYNILQCMLELLLVDESNLV
jgi:hypothetical protein